MFLLCALTQPRQLQDQICCIKCSDLIAGELGKFHADLSAVEIEFCKLTTSGRCAILPALLLEHFGAEFSDSSVACFGQVVPVSNTSRLIAGCSKWKGHTLILKPKGQLAQVLIGWCQNFLSWSKRLFRVPILSSITQARVSHL